MPPIILYAGLSVRKKAFFQFLPTSATLGILGTYIAFAVIALVLYAMSRPLGITLAVCALCSPHSTSNWQAMSGALHKASEHLAGGAALAHLCPRTCHSCA